MNWVKWKDMVRRKRPEHAGPFVPPSFALDLEPGFLATARLNPSQRSVQSADVIELTPGLLTPSPNRSNVADKSALLGAMEETRKRLGRIRGNGGLLVSDIAVRMALLQFETLPENRRQAESLVLWKMRDFLPYPAEEARVTLEVVAKHADSLEVLAIAMRVSVLAEYESLLEGTFGRPAVILPATVALLPLIPDDTCGQVLLHLSPGVLTAVVLADHRIRYWKTRAVEGNSTSNVEEVGREAARLAAACQDNLAVKVQNVWFCDRTHPNSLPGVEERLTEAFGQKPRRPSPVALSAGDLPLSDNAAVHQIAIPFAGLMANLN